MRVPLLIGALLALALSAGCGSSAAQNEAAPPAPAAPAPGALTLRYASPDRPEDSLVIERDAAGQIRAEDGGGQIFFVRDGVQYLVFTPPSPGGPVVARMEDVLALGAEQRANMLRAGALNGERDDTAYSIREEGEVTVGQWRGRRYSLNPQQSGVSLTVTVSSDPALAEARALAVTAFDAFEAPMQAMLVFPEQYVRLRGELLGRGALLAYDGRALSAVQTTPIPEARFALPGPVLSREALRARLVR